MDALAASAYTPQGAAPDKANNIFQSITPAWGNYLYQNVLPNLPSDWLSNPNPLSSNAPVTATNNAAAPISTAADTTSSNFFANEAAAAWSAQLAANQSQTQMPMLGQPGPSNYYMNYFGGSIAPALLAPVTASGSGSGTPSTVNTISPSVDFVDKIVTSPSPIYTSVHTPDSDAEGEHDPEVDARSQHSHHSEHDSTHEHDHDEGVERDGMIWGMKVDEYRALSARERKRVRNRISARTFRAKRKEHLSSLESTLGAKDLEIKLAHEENIRLRRELADMKRRLAKYESKPY